MRLYLLCLFLGLYASSCDFSYFDEMPAYTYNPEWIIPLINSSVVIHDFILELDSTLYYIDDENFVTLIYQTGLIDLSGGETFQLPEQFYSIIFEFAGWSNANKVLEGSHPFFFDVDWMQRTDSLTFLAGSVEVHLDSPDLLNNGFSYSAAVLFPELYDSQGNPVEIGLEVNEVAHIALADHTMLFYEDDPAHSLFDVHYAVEVYGEGDPDNLPYDMDLSISFADMEFKTILGSVKPRTLAYEEGEMDIDIFSTYKDGGIYFEQPEIKLDAKTSFGFDIHMLMHNLYGQRNDETVALEGFPYPWQAPAVPTENLGEINQVGFSLHPDNSNLSDFIQLYPDELHYDVAAVLVPEDDKSSGFISYDSNFSMDVALWLPLEMRIVKYVLGDTLSFPIAEDLGDIDWLEFKIDIKNGLPLSSELQIYFLDESDNVLMHLFDDVSHSRIIDAAPVNEDGIVTGMNNFLKYVYIDQERLNQINAAENMVFSVRLQTSNAGDIPVKIFSDYQMDIFVGLKAALYIEL